MENKAFITAFQQAAGLADPKAAADAATAIAASLADMLMEGRAVAIAGFGTFSPQFNDHSEVNGMLMPPSIEARFVAAASLRKHLHSNP